MRAFEDHWAGTQAKAMLSLLEVAPLAFEPKEFGAHMQPNI